MKKQVFVRMSFRLLQRRVHPGGIFSQDHFLWRQRHNSGLIKESHRK